MKAFFQDSFKELRHVQWPTPTETKDYFKIVVAFIIAFAIFIFIAGSVFSTGLFYARENLGLGQKTVATKDVSPIDLKNIKIGTGNTTTIGSGITVTPVASGATK